MSTQKQLSRPFSSKGIMLRADPSLIGPEYYSELTNMVSNFEGNLAIRGGTRRLLVAYDPAVGKIHSIARLITDTFNPNVPSRITYYFVDGDQILATNSALVPYMSMRQVATGVSDKTVGIASQRITTADFAPQDSGNPYKFFACPKAMLKDNGSFAALQNWGIAPPAIPALAHNTGSGPGPSAFANEAATPYKYVYTFRNPITGAESNPCMFMVDNRAITPNGHTINVIVKGTFDPQVPGTNGVAVYRSGGAFADGLYRFVGYSTNSGAPEAPDVIFPDTFQDSEIASNAILATDNDQPVPSALPVVANMVAFTWAGPNDTGGPGGQSGQISTMTIGIVSGPPGTDIAQFLTVGSIVRFGEPSPSAESCIIQRIDSAGPNTLSLYLQNDWQSFLPTTVTCTTKSGGSASLALAAFDSIFLAGDQFNPHVLYQSKPGQPESFGVLETATGISRAINVSNPSNPIMGLAEFNDAIVCLTRESIYVVQLIVGIMQTPVKSSAKHGLITRGAWCKTANEIWYVSYDGIYSWSGGEEIWRTEAIDPLFHGESVSGYFPIDMRPFGIFYGLDVMTLEYNGLEIFFNYRDIAGQARRLRYHTKFDRWDIEQFGNVAAIYTQYSEADTGTLLLGVEDTVGVTVYLDNYGTTDGAINTTIDGQPIVFAATPAFVGPDVQNNKLFSDFQIETSSDGDPMTIQTFRDYATQPDAVDVYTVNPSSVPQPRGRRPFSFNMSQGAQCYALGMRFSGSAKHALSLYSLTINYIELALSQSGFAFDWSDLGYQGDKVLRTLTIEMDKDGVPHSIRVQGDGVNVGLTLSMTTTYADRKRYFALPDGIVARMVRLVIVPGVGGFTNYYSHNWDKFDWPESLTFWECDWTDLNYQYDKVIRNLSIEVDTNGVPATITVLGDGAQIIQYSVTTTAGDKNRVFALPDGTIAKMLKVQVTGLTSTIRLFKWAFEKWDYPPKLTFWEADWTDLGYDHDKNMRTLTFECDTGGTNASVVFQADGATVDSFLVNTTIADRNRVRALPDNTVAKVCRVLITASSNSYIRLFNWAVDKWDYPAAITAWECDWTDLDWPYEKVLRVLNIDIDTGGQPATIIVQGDGVTIATFTVTATLLDRSRILTFPDNTVVKLVRILVNAAPGGYVRVFNFKIDKANEPPEVSLFDTYSFNFGYNGYNFVKQAWLMYQSTSPLIVTLFGDNDKPFFQTILPVQPNRDVQRFYLPAATTWPNGILIYGPVSQTQTFLNKSKRKRLTVLSQNTGGSFKIFRDGCRLEWCALGADQRQDYQQWDLGSTTFLQAT